MTEVGTVAQIESAPSAREPRRWRERAVIHRLRTRRPPLARYYALLDGRNHPEGENLIYGLSRPARKNP